MSNFERFMLPPINYHQLGLPENERNRVQYTLQERFLGEIKDRHVQEAEKKSVTDALTGLPSRAFYNQEIEKIHLGALRSGMPYSIIMVDGNDFKAINDRFGHPGGDKAIRYLGDKLGSLVRNSDFVIRLAGDEFLILLPGTSLQDATKLANRMLTHLHDSRFDIHGNGSELVKFTASFGIAAFNPPKSGNDGLLVTVNKSETPWNAIYENADTALYGAKEDGEKQLVCCYDEGTLHLFVGNQLCEISTKPAARIAARKQQAPMPGIT